MAKQEDCTPETWRIIRIKVTYKKRNVEDVGNHRPICTLPALYKLYSTTIIYNRLFDRLDRAQPEDQGGFRRSYRTLDHLATYRLLEQKCREWSIKMWDFKKAFDSISHQFPWRALEKCGIDSQYISLLREAIHDQKGTVLTDKESDILEENETG